MANPVRPEPASSPAAAAPAGGPRELSAGDGPGDGGAAVAALRAAIERAGYFPQLVIDAVEDAVGEEPVRAHLVHQETTFDSDEVRRHVSVLVLTDTRLVVTHTDDHPAGADSPSPFAATSAEVVPLGRVRSVVVNRVVPDPSSYVQGSDPHELVLTVGWGVIARVDLEPATCGDPSCEADHGYSGTLGSDDLSIRVSAGAEGPDVVAEAVRFGRALTRAVAAAGIRP